MRVAVIGYGVEGKAAVTYWSQLGHDITVCAPTLGEDLPEGVAALVGPDYLDGVDAFDLIVRSPGVHPGLLPSHGHITSVTREFLERCPGLVIGVTGGHDLYSDRFDLAGGRTDGVRRRQHRHPTAGLLGQGGRRRRRRLGAVELPTG